MSVIKCIEFGDRAFKSIYDRNDALLANMAKIVAIKSNPINSVNKGQLCYSSAMLSSEQSKKSVFDMQPGFAYPVINTTNVMDSHHDVHFPSIWDESLQMVKKELAYVLDHQFTIDSTIVMPGNVDAFTKNVPWVSLGANFPGETQALIYGFDRKDIMNDKARQIIDKIMAIQNSVRMSYVDMYLGLNDDRAEFKENKEYFDYRINSIVNKYLALESGYFWGQEKANIILEGSMVLRGSNSITPLILPDEEIVIEQKSIITPAQKSIANYKPYYMNLV